MSAQQAGKRYENKTVNALDRGTESPAIRVLPAGYSGNHAVPSPDFLVTTPKVDHAVEMKRSTIDRGDRTTIIERDDMQQLAECANAYTRVYLAVKFTRCELLVMEIEAPSVMGEWLVSETPAAFDTSLTKMGNVTMRKPINTSVWPSSRSGKSDVDVLMDSLCLWK